MKKLLLPLLVALTFCSIGFANDEEEPEDFSKKQIYNSSCYKDNNPALEIEVRGAIGCPPGSSLLVGGAVILASARASKMTCPLFGADYYFFSHDTGKCYKYDTAVNKSSGVNLSSGRWICYDEDENDCR